MMNERIKLLAEQAGFNFRVDCATDDEIVRIYKTADKVEKLAELIVWECIQVAVNKDSGYMHPANVAGYMAAGRSTAAQMIKEHFGVDIE
jgi:hypothetical protein